MRKVLFLLTIVFLLLVGYLAFAASTCGCLKITPNGDCKHENAECTINESGKECCEGLVCVPFNEQSGNGKCEPDVTPTPTDEVTPTPTEVEPTPEPTAEPTQPPQPGPKGPPEWEDPCFYLKDHPECQDGEPVGWGDIQTFGPQK